jgi:mRNA interferase MazF
VPLVNGHVPDAGDVLWVDYRPPVGHEQGGRRPSLVLTPRSYNEVSSVLLACPISRVDRDWPFQVHIGEVGRITGYALVDQLSVIDPVARYCRFAGRVSEVTLITVRETLIALLDLSVP